MEDLEPRRMDPLDYLRVLGRRRAWALAPLVASLAVGGALAAGLPEWYRASATLAVSAPELSPDLAGRPQPALDEVERTRAFEQQLLSSATLRRVASETGTPEAEERLFGEWRRRIEVQPAAPVTTFRGEATTFLVSFSDRSPEKAHQLASKLSEVFIEENNRAREARAEETAAFLENQLNASERRLMKLDEEIRQQKQENMGRLPQQTAANLQLVTGLRQQLEATSIALRGEQDRLSMIERQIETFEEDAEREAATLAGASPLSDARARVDRLVQQLGEARTRYTDQHPEVKNLQEELRSARAVLERERARPEPDRLATLELSPAYRQLDADRERSRLRIRELERTARQLGQQIATYQARIEAAPLVEQRMEALQRQYDLEKKTFEDLSARHKSATLAEDLQRRQGTERFTILYPASRPSRPYWPNRPRILLFSLAAGLVLGIALPFAREFLDRSVYDARALQKEFDIPVVGEIPRIGRAA